ncbi:MAG: leucine-rich repeat protein, partial [Lachnospiraceae bacterium]|nr:leucine-rich repeat protein [Lachnospiraceae bacterium]
MGKAKKVLAMFLAAVMMLTAFFAADADHVWAGQKEYDGEDGILSPGAPGDFTENNIEYYVTVSPYGSRSGEVYVVGCTFSMEKITIPGVVTHRGSKYNVVGIDNKAFENYENLTSVTIADGLTRIGEGAFWGCWYLESITLPKTLKELGKSAFEYCGSLKSISFPDSLTVIPDYVCANSAVSKVTFGSKVTEIGNFAFYECKNIKEVTLPASLKTIGSWAFGYCRNLSKITNKSKLKQEDLKNPFDDTKWERDQSTPTVDYTYSDKDMVISVYLDNKKQTKGYLYYRMNDNAAEYRCLKYDDWEHGVGGELKKDDEGNFILDKKYIESSGYPINGNFYYCKSKPKDFLKAYSFIFSTDDIPYDSELAEELYAADTLEAERIRPVYLYTMHYEQGEYECRYLPKDRILGRYSSIKIGEDTEMTWQGFLTQDPESPGRAFAYYADSTGRRLDSMKDITEPVTIHPVFVNEDELYTGKDYAAEHYYLYAGKMHSDDVWHVLADNVTIKSGQKLTERLVTANAYGLCIIDKKVTLSPAEVAKYRKGFSEDSWEWKYTSNEGSIYNYRDIIVVKSGGTLILDGIRLSNSVKITLQKGAKLKLINGTSLGVDNLGVQEGAEVEIVNSSISGEILNAGTITVTAPVYKTASDSFYAKSIAAEPFFNAKTGVVNLAYGKMSWGNDFDMEYGPGSVKADMRDADDAVVINNGTVNITEFGYLSMADGYQCREHKETYAKTPIVNNGTINIKSSAERYFEFSVFKLDCNTFFYYGMVKVTSDVKRSNRFADSYAMRTAVNEFGAEAEMELTESVF